MSMDHESDESVFIPDDSCSNCGTALDPFHFGVLGAIQKPIRCDRCGLRNRKDFRLPNHDVNPGGLVEA